MTSEPGVDAGALDLINAHCPSWKQLQGGRLVMCCTCGDELIPIYSSGVAGDKEFRTHLARAVQAYTEQRVGERVAEALAGAALQLTSRADQWSHIHDETGELAHGGRWQAYADAARIVREQAPTTGGGE